MSVRLHFPYELAVTTNRRLVPVAKGRFVTSKRWEQARRALQLHAMNQYRGDPLEGELWMELVAYTPDRRRRDLQNLPKLVLDSLEGICYHDDNQVAELHLSRRHDPDDPHVDLQLGTLAPA